MLQALCTRKMSEIRHLILATLINGPLAVTMFMSYIWYRYGFHWPSDFVLVFLFGTLLVALFLGVVCWPMLRFLVNTNNKYLSMFVCSIAGIVCVVLFFILFTHYHFNMEFMVYKLWLYHLIFSVVGSIYGYMYFRHHYA